MTRISYKVDLSHEADDDFQFFFIFASMRKTTWLISADKIQLYPFRVYRPISIAVGLVFIAIWSYMLKSSPVLAQEGGIVGGYTIIILFSVLLFAVGNTFILFDANRKRVYCKLAGFITIQSLAFDDIAVIQPVTGTSIVYRIFTKNDRHGKGHTISSYYSGWKDKDLAPFQQEVLPAIDKMVFGSPDLRQEPTYVPITDFRFFTEKDGAYVMKMRKIPMFIFMLLFLAWWLYALLTPGYADNQTTAKKMLAIWFPFGMVILFAFAVFNVFIFDVQKRTITQSLLGGLIRRTYRMDDFIRFRIVRKTTNMVYSGTEIRMEMAIPNSTKIRFISLRQFNSTKQIERFLQETEELLGVRR